jgi:nucleoside-diphosphate-sugar epimerase
VQSSFKVCLTGATGWLGRSFLEVMEKEESNTVQLSIWGRTETKITTSLRNEYLIHEFDLSSLKSQSFHCFAPFSFLTRDKSLHLSRDEYIRINRKLIDETTTLILYGNMGSVINTSSGVLSQFSDSQKSDRSYEEYANLKREQEEKYSAACSKVGIPLINCRIFSLTGEDMKDPLKYAVGDIANQALTNNSVVLNSKAPVVRRYMDSRDLVHLLIDSARAGIPQFIESSGVQIDLTSFAKKVLTQLGLNSENVKYRSASEEPSNIYYSKKNDMENLAARFGLELKSLEQQVMNVVKAVKKLPRH